MNIGLLFALIIALFCVSLYLIHKWIVASQQQSTSPEMMEWLKSSTQTINARLDSTQNVISQVQKNIGEFSEIGRSMKDLQDFLQSPKMRGNIGEQVLGELLRQHMPPDSFALQHTFKSGEKVDAIVKASFGYIPIDSKFPMENMRAMLKAETEASRAAFKKDFIRDVKKHIQDIAKKYILVHEGTADYALMYIPFESIYYEIINDADLYEYAGSKRVLPVSPMSFYAYIKAILMSYEGQKIQTQAKEILAILQGMKKDYEKTDESLGVLNKHVTNAYNQMFQVNKSVSQLGQKIASTRSMSSPVETQEKLIE
ncbi:DNA recombination protein RmuC [Candidatus Microgenomates bacterium]|nr:DNA recombination protein RmuC [Candidatus Microgenomates bacterium]